VDFSTGSVGIGATATNWAAMSRRFVRPRTPRLRDSANATVKERLKDADDEPEPGILKDMMLAGYDSPGRCAPCIWTRRSRGATDSDAGPREPHVPRQLGLAAGASPR